MKNLMVKFLFCAFFVSVPIVCFGQISLISALCNSKTLTESKPFEFRKSGVLFSRTYSFHIDNSNNAIPDKLYNNIQMTSFSHAGNDYELEAKLYRKFAIPNSTNILAVVSFGGASDWLTNVVCVVNPSGQILSTLEGTVQFGNIAVKQFRINSQCQIIVTTISTTNTTSLPFESFTSFVGQRKDVTYSINSQGLFVVVSETLFQPKTYTKVAMNNAALNLWQGGEIL
jgi:hypothetical protein